MSIGADDQEIVRLVLEWQRAGKLEVFEADGFGVIRDDDVQRGALNREHFARLLAEVWHTDLRVAPQDDAAISVLIEPLALVPIEQVPAAVMAEGVSSETGTARAELVKPLGLVPIEQAPTEVLAQGIRAEVEVTEATAPPAENASAESCALHWKMRIQIEAAAHWRRLRGSGASPTRYSILPWMVDWCRKNDVRTDGGIIPSQGYLRTHVLSRKHWMPPT